MNDNQFVPSKLGSKEHWDLVYAKELASYRDIGDEGEIWFGEESVNKMVRWAAEHVPSSEDPMILELGSGNGTLLFSLVEQEAYSPTHLCGIDYSSDAVELAKSIAHQRGVLDITFHTCDFLFEDPPSILQESSRRIDSWDLLLDKGTFDAIALGEKDKLGRPPVLGYPVRVGRLIKPGGYLLITSCNFTKDELKTNLVTQESGLIYHSDIKYPTFTFGGHSGAKYSSVAFQKTMHNELTSTD